MDCRVLVSFAFLTAHGQALAVEHARQAESTGPALRAGVAMVDITPPESGLPQGYEGIHDRLYARAIVLDDGRTRAALVSVDAGAISEQTWQTVSVQVSRNLGIPVDQLIVTATHTHSAPMEAGERVAGLIVEAVRRAGAAPVPARISYGSGESYINVNRNIIDRKSNRWWEGPNRDGPSDKTVSVMYVETLAGVPLAVWYNYAVHAVLLGQLDQISADLPGAASAYIERSLGNGAIALWSEGAAGDQNPLYFQQTYDLRAIRVQDFATRGVDISNAMPPGGQGLDRSNPRVALLMDQQQQMALSMGQMLGEEVLHVIRDSLERAQASPALQGAQSTFTCPGRRRTDSGRAGFAGSYVDADPIPIRLSLLEIGDIAIGGVNAEVFNTVATRLKRESPLKHTVMATLTNGLSTSGYIPNEAAFGFNTFEVVSSNLRPGCAEAAIVGGLLELIGTVSKARPPGDKKR